MATIEHGPGASSELATLLLAERARVRLLSAHTKGILFQFDGQGRFVHVWASDPTLLAKPEAELIGLTVSEALGVESGAVHDEAIQRALRTGVGDEYEYSLDLPSGRRCFVAASTVIATPAEERAVVYWIRDVTDKVEARVRDLHNERLATIGRLAAGVAHEINNPLAYISLNLEGIERRVNALRKRPSSSTQEDFEDMAQSLSMIREGSTRVQRIVKDLLNFSRVDDALTCVDVIRALSLALELVSTEAHEHVTLHRNLGPTPLVLADEGRLIQVFVNLLANAIQAIERNPSDNERRSGEVHVRATTDTRGWAVVEVRDNGCGIEKNLLGKIFEPFYTTKPYGVGLGLALCQTLVLSFSGQLEVVSEAGKGSCFSVLLPPFTA